MVRVREFDPVIYPRRLWIAVTTENLADRFKDLEEFEADYASAATDSTADILRNFRGVIIRFRSMDDMDVKTISHESVHAANIIFAELGVKADTDNDEHLAYLVGWIARCCEKAREMETEPAEEPAVYVSELSDVTQILSQNS